MNKYIITQNIIVGGTQYRVGLYRVDNQWHVDSDYFGHGWDICPFPGGVPVNTLRGKLADVVDSAIKNWESV